jgi:hypothetical protein
LWSQLYTCALLVSFYSVIATLVVPCLDIVERPFLQESTDFTGLLLLASLMTIALLNIQASSPLQVKYADGELERLGNQCLCRSDVFV